MSEKVIKVYLDVAGELLAMKAALAELLSADANGNNSALNSRQEHLLNHLVRAIQAHSKLPGDEALCLEVAATRGLDQIFEMARVAPVNSAKG